VQATARFVARRSAGGSRRTRGEAAYGAGVITSADFFIPTEAEDPLGTPVERVDRERLASLIATPDSAASDLDVAIALMDFVRDDLTSSAIDGRWRLNEQDMRLAARALQRVTARVGQEFKLPFQDHDGWRTWWKREGAGGSRDARRELLGQLFDEPYAALLAAQDRALDAALVTAISPRGQLGWPEVDEEISQLRRRFRAAESPQDYRAVGNDCVHLTEALSRKVYDNAKHTPEGEDEPAVQQTKLRLTRYVDAQLPGPGSAELRKFARSAIELAQAVKHSSASTRTEAGITADAVIVLANMLRRVEDDEPG
jgi:hypothetical protein